MRLTVRLDEDVYTAALALADSERISIAEAINRLVRRAVQTRPLPPKDTRRMRAQSRFPTSAGKRLITSRDVEQIDAADDERALGSDR
jgi:antitoxin component of RelBE/YafQ-DinJ toxin-antitoxin module